MVILAAAVIPFSASAEEPYQTYTYSYNREPKESPAAFTTGRIIDIGDLGIGKANTPSNLFVDGDENVYIADSGNNRIVVLNKSYEVKGQIGEFHNSVTDAHDSLKSPSGVFVTATGDIYAADTENFRIVHFDKDFKFVRTIDAPNSSVLPDEFTFKPYNLTLDETGRIFAVAKSTNMGIIEFSPKGEFSGFVGAQKVSVNPLDLLWRTFMTEEQIARDLQFVSSEYNNIAIDEKGFLYVTTNAINDWDLYAAILSRSSGGIGLPVRKLNPKGIDVLKRNGFFPPVGDCEFPLGNGKEFGASQIIDVAIKGGGVYSILDGKRNKIFTYNENGDLLYAFGSRGIQKGSFDILISIAYKGNSLLCLDQSNGLITIFEPTAYANKISEAITSFNRMDYDSSTLLWNEILQMNSNFDSAYVGLGKCSFFSGDYKEAMRNFKIANNTTEYSKAFKYYRNEVIEKIVFLIPVALIIIIVLLFWFMKFSGRINSAFEMPKSKGKRLVKQLMYSFYVIVHPIDGAWCIKREQRGGLLSAIIINITAVAVFVFSQMGGGYIFNPINPKTMNIAVIISNIVLPVLLFCVANWCFTALMDGEGSFKQIYIHTAYSLMPVIILVTPAVIMSYFCAAEEMFLINFFISLAFIWTFILIFFGMLTIHDYTLGKNILVSLCSIAGMAILLFIALLFFDLFTKMSSFFVNTYSEITFRS